MSDSFDKRKRAGVAAVFWLIIALILLIVFLVNQDNIVRILKETEFFVHVFGDQPEFIENYELPEKELSETDVLVLEEEQILTETKTVETLPVDTVSIATSPEEEQIKNVVEEISSAEEVEDDNNVVQENPLITPQAMSNQHLYFVFVNTDGTIERKESVRSIPKSTTPLTQALQALITGPNTDERTKEYMTFIPSGTELLSVSIKDGIAYINFNDAFSFNQYGVEGYLAQLMQIVYTATSFSSIKSVRFLIEGEQSSYLGNDGVWIGEPLTRTDFK